MKKLINVLFFSLIALSALAQNEGSVGDMSSTSRTTRFAVRVDGSNLPYLKIGSTTAQRLALLSDVVAAAGGGVQQVNGISPTSGNVNITFANLIGKPTTISGFGITDGVSTGGTYANPTWLTSLAAAKVTGLSTVGTSGLFADLLSKPTTLTGYGITDAVSTGGSYTNPTWLVSIPFAKLTAVPTTLAGHSIADGVSTGGSYANPSWLTSLAWSKITSAPTTLSGYGITDADPYVEVATYTAMDALTFPANTARRVLVKTDGQYSKTNQWYMVWADAGGTMHADKLVTISEK